MPKKTFAPLLLLNWLSWHQKLIPLSASHLHPVHFFTASVQSKDLTLVLRNTLVLTALGYFHQNSARTKLGVYACVEFTPFVKSSASNGKRLIFSLKFQFQNTKVRIILILYSCGVQFIIMSQRTIHLACIFFLYHWNCPRK